MLRNRLLYQIGWTLSLSFANTVESNFQLNWKSEENLEGFKGEFSETKTFIYTNYNLLMKALGTSARTCVRDSRLWEILFS